MKSFEYQYSAPTEEERKEIASIRKQYARESEGEDKLARLRYLDKQVKGIASMLSLAVGIIGILIFGLGMSMSLVWEQRVWGAVVSLVGGGVMAIAYPLYKWQFASGKKKHGEEILRLSEELLADK